MAQRTMHGLQTSESTVNEKNSNRELTELAEQAKRRAEVARLGTRGKITLSCFEI